MSPSALVQVAVGTVFPWQGGLLDKIAVGTFGIIVTIVLAAIVLLDSEWTWLDDALREQRRKTLRRKSQAKGVRRRLNDTRPPTPPH